MTCTPASLAANVSCLICLNDNQLDGITTLLWRLYYEQLGPTGDDHLLLEDGGHILLEDGGKILLE